MIPDSMRIQDACFEQISFFDEGTVRGLPYDNDWSAGSGGSGGSTTNGGGFASKASGRFLASSQVGSSSGSVWGGGGLANWFRPLAPNIIVRFGVYAAGEGNWADCRRWTDRFQR